MKQFYLLVSFILVLNSHQATAQNDSIYFWKGGVLDLKKSIKTADLDSITFRRVVPATPENLTGEAISTTELLLMWTDRSTNESGFKIERKLVSGSFVVIGTTATNIFTFSDKGLTPNTSYIYRVYSYNAAGKSTVYSNELTLTTKALLPSVTTTTVASLTTTTAESGGTITADGGSTISARGIVWSTTPNPTITLSTKTSDGVGTGSFSSSIIGLNASTTYYVRAYATNSGGTGYGSEVSFTTATADIITIGTQSWTTKNLDVATYSDGTVIPQVTDPKAWAALTTGAWCYYNNDAATGNTYGKLYNWYAVAGIHDTDPNTPNKKLAPTGYHVPTDAEWTTLTDYLGGQAGGKMKAIGSSDWWLKDVTNSSGFTGLLGGYRIWWGTSSDIGLYGKWWSSSEIDATTAWYRLLYSFNNSVGRGGTSENTKKFGLSVRCLRDTAPTVGIATTAVSTIAATTARTGATITSDGGAAITKRGVVWSTLSAPTIALSTKTTDGSGTESFSSLMTGLSPQTKYYVRAYATNSFGTAYGNEVNFITLTSTSRPGEVAVGTQSWTTKNLDVATYSDGTAIPEVKDPTQWNNLTTGAWCYLENDPANGTTYGKLYNLYAVLGIWNEASKTDNTERKKLAPIGYHMPSNDEWITLTSFLGGDAVAGVKMKATTSWDTYGNATNSSGFSGLQGGSRNNDGTFANYSTQWWSDTEKDNAYGGIYLSPYSDAVSSPSTGSCSKAGFSVRCVRDKDVAPSPGTVPEFGSLTTSAISTSVTTAKSGAIITSDGGSTITERGIVWSTSSSPTIFVCWTKTTDGSGIGSFSSLMTDLSPGTTYYVRAYATNKRGTAYGAEVIFTTLKTYTIGLWPDLGGYVFSLDNDGLHGLVAETIDQSSNSNWYNAPSTISNPANHSLDGANFMPYWRLPTIDELNQMYNVRDKIGNFSGSFYWSSTLNNKYDWYAWNIDFRDGTRRYGSKDSNSFAVRAVRNF